MKFGHTLLAAQWGPWQDVYIPYKALKKILKACTNGAVSFPDAEGAFMTRLLNAVGSVDTFFASQVPDARTNHPGPDPCPQPNLHLHPSPSSSFLSEPGAQPSPVPETLTLSLTLTLIPTETLASSRTRCCC